MDEIKDVINGTIIIDVEFNDPCKKLLSKL